ncbi:MAG TPA: type II toxin-antitoxin system VapC family toxin [Burkholderiales bacterium]|nr:type II toxin-antitoxin system VapC family toxin [Burkholderiales bacterium]
MSKVFFDTNLFIYLLEDYGNLSKRVESLWQNMTVRKDALYTSTFTLAEVLVKPTGSGDVTGMTRFERLLAAAATLIAFDEKAARMYATIRQDRSISPPDAIQLACAAAVGMDLFITNDQRLSRKVVPGIHFITSLDTAYL